MLSNQLYLTVTESMFIDTLKKVRPYKFTTQSLINLYQHLMNELKVFNTPMELDAIKIHRDYSEESGSEIRKKYSLGEDVDIEEYLLTNTMLVGKFINDITNETIYTYLNF